MDSYKDHLLILDEFASPYSKNNWNKHHQDTGAKSHYIHHKTQDMMENLYKKIDSHHTQAGRKPFENAEKDYNTSIKRATSAGHDASHSLTQSRYADSEHNYGTTKTAQFYKFRPKH